MAILSGDMASFSFFFPAVELSEVMWNMGMRIAMKKADGIGSVFLFIIFAVWAGKCTVICGATCW